MDRFVRFLVILLAAAVAVAATLVVASDYRSEKTRAAGLAAERKSLGDHLLRIQDSVRKVEIVVEQQVVKGELVRDTGDARVVETKLLVFPYGFDGSGQPIGLTPTRLIIKGNRLTIDALRLDMPKGVLADGYPGSLSIPLFGHFTGADEPVDESTFLVPWGMVHPGFRPDDAPSSEFERVVWRRIGDIVNNKALRTRVGGQVTLFAPLSIDLRPGLIYQVYLGRDLPLNVGKVEDPRRIHELLLQAPGLVAPKAPADGRTRLAP